MYIHTLSQTEAGHGPGAARHAPAAARDRAALGGHGVEAAALVTCLVMGRPVWAGLGVG